MKCQSLLDTTTGDAGTYTVGTSNGLTQTNPGFRGAYISVIFSAISGSSPVIHLDLQFSPDGGTTWVTFDSGSIDRSGTSTTSPSVFLMYPGISGTYVTEAVPYPLPQIWRVTYRVTGADSSYTLNTFVNYMD